MRNRQHKLFAIVLATLALFPTAAFAGMPAPMTLTEMARMRLEVISFFLAILLASAGLIQLLWNTLRKNFTRLPLLNYWRALALVMLWGLLVLIILLMISAARELMTPGAWQRDGTLYHLKQGPK
jgi:hypothetical protein